MSQHPLLFTAEHHWAVWICLHYAYPFISDGIWVASTFWLLWMNNVHPRTSFYLLRCFHSLGYMSRNEILGSYGNSVSKFLMNCQTIPQSSCTILYFLNCMFLHILGQHLLLSVILSTAVPENVRWYHFELFILNKATPSLTSVTFILIYDVSTCFGVCFPGQSEDIKCEEYKDVHRNKTK